MYLPPLIAHQPAALDGHPVLPGDLDAWTLASDGAISGRRPAYVPTMSSRVIVDVQGAVDACQDLVDLGAARAHGRSTGPWNGSSVVPITQWRGHGTMNADAARDPERHAALDGDPLARDHEVAAARRQDVEREPSPPNGRSGIEPQTPVASRTAAARTSKARRP